MEKILEYKLNIGVDEKFSFMPVLHDYKVSEMKIEDKKIVLISNDVSNHDDDSSNFAGFKPKSVKVEFINDEYMQGQWGDPDMMVRVMYYGKRKYNKYHTFCEEFFDTIKEYDELEIIYPSVSFREVILTLWGEKRKKRCNIMMQIACDKVRYIFTD